MRVNNGRKWLNIYIGNTSTYMFICLYIYIYIYIYIYACQYMIESENIHGL
jgi:hypothetical protein